MDEPTILGMEWVAQGSDSPIGYELSLRHHRESKVVPITGDTDFESTELSFGVRKTLVMADGSLRPYFGAGLSLFYSDRDNSIALLVGQSGSDLDSGAYLHVGVDAPVSDHVFMGLDVRFLHESSLEYGGFDLDGNAVTLRIGWAF
ncbi:MAG: outer membrane beta-barrel protein [bacterium]|nr:outer membrane beta-barrel protein [bacterium]